MKFRDVITPFSGISATNGDFTSEKRCVLTQKKIGFYQKTTRKVSDFRVEEGMFLSRPVSIGLFLFHHTRPVRFIWVNCSNSLP